LDYDRISFRLSKEVTKGYSTSFYSASKLFAPEIRSAIWSIYGFVRLADEIVDTFHDFDQPTLLSEFEKDFDSAVEKAISLNPILHAFQRTVRDFGIPHAYVRAFLESMKQDLTKKTYENASETSGYIYGSADVVGLMCLKVFCKQDEALFGRLEASAMRLGSAFQKVNFLRDLGADRDVLGRTYFPELVGQPLTDATKGNIVLDIRTDFEAAEIGLRQLPDGARTAVWLAFAYYRNLLKRLDKASADDLMRNRIRVPDAVKGILFVRAWLRKRLTAFGL
jgi:phytoene/squalene synthetase